MSCLQCTPAMIQVPCKGGSTVHVLEAIGTERLAFKVKLKQKYYDLFKVSPPLGFVKPGTKKELYINRLPGKPCKTKLVLEYIASPAGYDPRKPFVEGADVGILHIRVRAYADYKIADKTPTIMGKVVTKAGQKYTPPPAYDDLKLETEIDNLYKGKTIAAQPMKEKEPAKEKGKEEEEESSSSEEDDKKKGKKDGLPIQLVIPNLWKDPNIGQAQKSNDELKMALDLITNENKRLEEIIKQMMKEITFLRESLLSTVLKLASSVTAGGQPQSKSPTSIRSGSTVSSGHKTSYGTGISRIKSTTASTHGGTKTAVATGTSRTTGLGATGGSRMSSPAAISASRRTSPAVTGVSRITSPATTGVSRITSPTVTGVSRSTIPAATGAHITSPTAVGVSSVTSPTAADANHAISPATGSATDVDATKRAVAAGVSATLSETGASAEVEKYLSAMLAGGGPTGESKGKEKEAGELKEFSLYSPGATAGATQSAYMTPSKPSPERAKNVGFAFGNTADQLDRGGSSGGGSSGYVGGSSAGGSRGQSVYL